MGFSKRRNGSHFILLRFYGTMSRANSGASSVALGGEVKRIAACSLVLMFVAGACTRTAAVHPPRSSPPSSAFVSWSQRGRPEKRLCVLPFVNKTKAEGLADRVRESLFGRIVLKQYTDIDLRDLDARLSALSKPWATFSPRQLGQALQCDALLYGEVTDASNVYLGVYAQLTVEGRIRLVDTVSNHVLMDGTHATKFRVGGVPLSLFELVPNAVLNLRNFSSEQMLRAIDDLSRNLADKVPDLPQVQTTSVAVSTDRNASSLAFSHPPSESYRLQVAAFSKPGEAQHAVQLLRNEGFQPTIVTATQSEKSWHKVMLGPFSSLDAAQETGVRVQKRLPFSPVVVRLSPQ